MDLSYSALKPMNEKAAVIISEWEYPSPYAVYNFKGNRNGYLFDKKVWGIELFYLACDDNVIGQIACQYVDNDLWIGWAFAPELCGDGNGTVFISKCIEEIRRVKEYSGPLFLKVAAWNKRAIKAYEKAGFMYVETIVDEIAYTNNSEDFWVMKQTIIYT